MENIPNFFADKAVFITGATGYIGKGVVEKLLRSCPNIKTIYALVRDKKGVRCQDRMQELFASPIFDVIKSDYPQQLQKVICIPGDIENPMLGLSESNLQILITEVTVIIHIAATVKFNEHLRIAMAVNVGATQEVLKIAKMISKIESVVHVSTAYSNCNRYQVDEEIYEMSEDPFKLLEAVKLLDDDLIEMITPKLLGNLPNTYTFTKALAEKLVKEEKEQLPISIVRPSIVMTTWKEPFPGFVDNWTGLNGFFASGINGLVKAMFVQEGSMGDVVPLDKVVNLIIAAAWKKAINRDGDLKIYHGCAGKENSVMWKSTLEVGKEFTTKFAFKKAYRKSCVTLYQSWLVYCIANFFDHYLPCFLMDVNAILHGREPKMLGSYSKLSKAIETVQWFLDRKWSFSTEKAKDLFESLTATDKVTFNFNTEDIVWRNFLINSCYGIQRYVLKDESMINPPIPEHLLSKPCESIESFSHVNTPSKYSTERGH